MRARVRFGTQGHPTRRTIPSERFGIFGVLDAHRPLVRFLFPSLKFVKIPGFLRKNPQSQSILVNRNTLRKIFPIISHGENDLTTTRSNTGARAGSFPAFTSIVAMEFEASKWQWNALRPVDVISRIPIFTAARSLKQLNGLVGLMTGLIWCYLDPIAIRCRRRGAWVLDR